MPYKLGALVLHGMGSQRADFADPMIDKLSERISSLGADPGEVRWKPVHWAPILQSKEDQLWDNLSTGNRLDYAWLRRFVVSNFGDAVAYLNRVPSQPQDMYSRIHTEVHDQVVALRSELGNADKPLIVIAHSLGSIIMSNYIWDEQRNQGFGGTAFEKMETLAGFFTFGSTIAVVSLAYDPIESIVFPPAALPDPPRSVARWDNFFDRDDVLGYPLKSLSSSYGASVSADREINAGGLLFSWNPFSHTRYWTDKDFVRPVAQSIADLLQVL